MPAAGVISAFNVVGNSDWAGPGAQGNRAKRRFRWSRLLWALVWPQGGQRIVPTVSGLILIGLSFGLGTAAYNSSSNILFITLSLLLSCLILSGVLSWLNLRGVAWKLELMAPWRAGQMATAALSLRNAKTFLPTYGLWFEFVAQAVSPVASRTVESTITGKGIDVRAELKKADAGQIRGTVPLGDRLEPVGELSREWSFTPTKRGRLRVELAAVGSLFPFGFLRKQIRTEVRRELTVWPAPVEYRRFAGGGSRQMGAGEPTARVGSGGELLALRKYATGDSHRLIHWKASARTRQLLVRQFTEESSEGFALWFRTEAERWPAAEQFEVAVSFVATLAEDLFRAGRLKTVAIDGDLPLPIRHVRDLETFLDRLAVVEVTAQSKVDAHGGSMTGEGTRPTAKGRGRKQLLTFAADGARGVAAYVDGNKTAAA